MKKYIAPAIFFLMCLCTVGLRYFGYIPSDANANFYPLILTALIILWYTFETSEIRKYEHLIAKVSEENLKRQKQPVIGYNIYTHSQLNHQTRINITNLSDYPLAARINCNFRLNNELIEDYSDAYNGRKFWNLQYRDSKEGHFSWLELHVKKGLMEASVLRKIQQLPSIEEKNHEVTEIISLIYDFKPPKLTMDIEIYCENDMGFHTYYPPVHYDYDYLHSYWVPILESEKPYWKYDSKPKWIDA